MKTSQNSPALSVVISFRDWGLERLAAAITFHLINSRPLHTEVIVSDYGSAEPNVVRRLVEAAGGRVVRSDTADLPWSRAAALNAGVEAATGEVVITTDADIIFSPECYCGAVEAVRRNPHAVYLVQCRDLPASHDVVFFENIINTTRRIDFEELWQSSTLRPRWGMGGFVAFTQESFFRLNGLDERMKIWGAEDADFVKRFELNRMPARWLSRKGAAIFHIWHGSSEKKAYELEETRKAVKLNRKILREDHTSVRNLTRLYRYSNPLISIVIPTYKRPDFLKQALRSCQAQTFPNFEVLIVENGDSEVSDEICRSFNDPRFKYIKTNSLGAAAARNIGNMEARGKYIVVHHDDDLMVSTRLERHISAMKEGKFHGSYCGWIDFNERDGSPEAYYPGKQHSFPAMLAQGRVMVHAGLMLEASILQAFKYDETGPAGDDFALLFSLTYQGMTLAHTGSFGLLRRLHGTNMISEQSATQEETALLGVRHVTQHLSEAELSELKRIGRQSSQLTCDNKKHALAELALYAAGKALPPKIPLLPDRTIEGSGCSRVRRRLAKFGVLLGRPRNPLEARSRSTSPNSR